MVSRRDHHLMTNNSQFYFLLPHQLLETCRREAARKSISTASYMREALIAYLGHQDPEPSIPIRKQTECPSIE